MIRLLLTLCFASLPLSLVRAQVVEEFVVASGPPRFAEQPLVAGNVVAWQRYGPERSPDMIQLKDISRLDGGVLDVAPFPAFRVGLVLSADYVFWGYGGVVGRRLEDLRLGSSSDVRVGEVGFAVAATSSHVFVQDWRYVGGRVYEGRFLARRLPILGRSDEAPQEVTEFRQAPLIGRSVAASERYFVWQDRNPDAPEDTWKIHARRIDRLFDSGEDRTVDTRILQQPVGEGVYLYVHDSRLIFEGASTTGETRSIYLLDLDTQQTPTLLRSGEDPNVRLTWPSISGEYAIWAEDPGFFDYAVWGIRLQDGRPVGDRFRISGPKSGGSWPMIDRNIVVWNGAAFVGGDFLNYAVVAAELDLPGAEDVGDVDQNGRINIGDAIAIINYLFLGGWQPRLRLADADLNRAIGLSDAVAILEYLFRGGQRPGLPR